MLGTAKNYDVICLQMRTYVSHSKSPLKQEMGKLTSEIKLALTSGKKVKPSLDAMLSSIFNFRVKALRWLIKEGGFNPQEIIDEVYPQLEELKGNPKLTILAENILFALRCNKRFLDSVISSTKNNEGNFELNISQLPDINYEQFITSIAMGVPDDITTQKIIDIMHSSLYIEFIILSAVIINEDKISVTDEVIDELAFLIADAAQEYSAIATELGIFKTHFPNNLSHSGSVDQSFKEEQQHLSELGLSDFIENFDR